MENSNLELESENRNNSFWCLFFYVIVLYVLSMLFLKIKKKFLILLLGHLGGLLPLKTFIKNEIFINNSKDRTAVLLWFSLFDIVIIQES